MFVYQAETFCDSCGEWIRADLLAMGEAPARDSDEWPQGPFPEEPTDSPDHCASGRECFEGIHLGAYGLADDAPLYGAESRVIGALLSDGLTEEGGSYVALEAFDNPDPTPYQSALHRLWWESFSSEVQEARVRDAGRRGVEDGTAAGSWVIDGNTSEESARALLQGLEDGDPAVYDSLPSAPLSGEWADGLLPRDVLGWYGVEEDDNSADEILSAYEQGWEQGVTDEVSRAARAMLGVEVSS